MIRLETAGDATKFEVGSLEYFDEMDGIRNINFNSMR